MGLIPRIDNSHAWALCPLESPAPWPRRRPRQSAACSLSVPQGTVRRRGGEPHRAFRVISVICSVLQRVGPSRRQWDRRQPGQPALCEGKPIPRGRRASLAHHQHGFSRAQEITDFVSHKTAYKSLGDLRRVIETGGHLYG